MMHSFHDQRARVAIAFAVAAAFGLLGCSDDQVETPTFESPPESPADGEYDPDIPAQWAASVTNPLFPLQPGTAWRYETVFAADEDAEDETEVITVEVLEQTRSVKGVEATIVRDRVRVDGELVEDTYDWYAQDADGNVWYLGEDSKEIEDGEVVSTEGSWEWGVDGALPGIIMWANPGQHVGETYRQEYYEGEAEDLGRVVALDQNVEVPAGSFTGCIQTDDWNALEPEIVETKYYCPSVGVTLEVEEGTRVELVELDRPTGPSL